MDVAAVLIDASAKLAALGVLVWLGTRRAGVAQARLAHAAWLGVLAGTTALPFLTLWLAPSTSIVPSAALRNAVPVISADLPGWILGVYALIAAAMLVRLGAGVRGIARLRQDSVPVVPANRDEAALVEACAAHSAVLLETGAVAVPATAGAWRPGVFLPRGWRDLDAGLVAAIVRHELAHVRRRAYGTIVAAELFKAFFWFHPVAWLACARLRWFEELACDRAAAGDDVLRYARALVALARMASHRPPALALSGGSQLARRIDLLIDAPRRTPWWAAATLSIAVGVLSLLPFVRFALSAAPAPVTFTDHAAAHALRHGAHPH